MDTATRLPKWAALLIIGLMVLLVYQWTVNGNLKQELHTQQHATNVAVAAHAELQQLASAIVAGDSADASASAHAHAHAHAGGAAASVDAKADASADDTESPAKPNRNGKAGRMSSGAGASAGAGDKRKPAPRKRPARKVEEEPVVVDDSTFKAVSLPPIPEAPAAPAPTAAGPAAVATSASAGSTVYRRKGEACAPVTKVCPVQPLADPSWDVPYMPGPPPPRPSPRPYNPSSTGGAELVPLSPPVCLVDPVCIPWGPEPPTIIRDPSDPPQLVRGRFNARTYRADGQPFNWFWGVHNPEGYYRWEQPTFETFHKFITADTIHIDFGSWIGPTALFAALHAKAVYAMEPDPIAREALLKNVEANPSLAPKIKVFANCISNKKEVLKMGGDGQSGSAISAVGDANYNAEVQRTGKSWSVNCDTLPEFFRSQGLSKRERYFVKIDTESAESFIIPQLYDWLKTWNDDDDGSGPYHGKPTIVISMHKVLTPEIRANANPGIAHNTRLGIWPWWNDDINGHAFLKTLLLYRSVSTTHAYPTFVRDINPITVQDIKQCMEHCPTCHWGCDLLLTDIDY